MRRLKLGVPDLVSNSYFAAIAAVELGTFEQYGIAASIELIFPSNRTFAALGNGEIDFVAAPAHSALAVFPGWKGCCLASALSQGTYWLLVMNKRLAISPGDLAALKGKRIGAAPFVEMSFRQLLLDAGFDPVRDDIQIVPVPGADEPGASLGVAAACALQAGLLDGFWANGLGAEISVSGGIGTVVLDVRRGLGPAFAFDYTFPALVASQQTIATDPELIADGVRAVIAAQARIRDEPALARKVGDALFPAAEAELIEQVVQRDLPYYRPHISPSSFNGLVRFAQARQLLKVPVEYAEVVGARYAAIWDAANP